MKARCSLGGGLLVFLPLALPGVAQQPAKPFALSPPAATYARDIRPILQARCVVCHNADALANLGQSGGLALDTWAGLRKGVVSGSGARAIYLPGKPDAGSLLRRLMAASPSLLMPRGGPPLAPAQITRFRAWIAGGALPGILPKTPVLKTASFTASLASLPANPGALEVVVATRVPLPPDLKPKAAPSGQNAALDFALKVGPLPPVLALAYSPDGKTLAVGGYRAVTIWDTTLARPVAYLTGFGGAIQSLAFRPDGAILTVAGGAPGRAGELRCYDARTLAPTGPAFTGHTDLIYQVAWSPDGKSLATASHDKTARLWDWPSGKTLRVFRDHAEAVTRVCFAPDGKALYTASLDHNLRRFDLATGQLVRTLSGHNEGVSALAVNAKGDRLLSAGIEPRLRWWNPDNGETQNYSDGHNQPVNDIEFSHDGKLIASVSGDHQARLWNEGGGFLRTLDGASDWLYAVAFSPDGKFVAGAGADGATRIWESANGRLRVCLLSWPMGARSGEWAALTPEGYFDASPAWAARLHPATNGHPLGQPRLTAFFQTLHQPQNVLKAWAGQALEPATLPIPPKPVKPAAPAGK